MRYSMVDPGGGPPGRAGALMPTPTTTPRASSGGLVRVFGAPGTMPVPAPRPSAIPPVSADPRTQPSACAPDYMLPSVYVPSAANMHPPMCLQRINELPVPAISPYALPRIAQRSRRMGGQNQVVQPPVVQTWPAWRGGGSN